MSKPEKFTKDNLTKQGHYSTPSEVSWSKGPIIPLLNFYGASGIPFRVLFVFDLKFIEEFENKEGKSVHEHMESVIALVKWQYQDSSLRDNLGTTINIIGTYKRLMKRFPSPWTQSQIN